MNDTAARVELPVDVRRIAQLLPHRYPFLLVDRVIAFEPGKRLTGLKNVTVNEPCFTGHFPDNPVMPGVLILEALAQAVAATDNQDLASSLRGAVEQFGAR